MNNNQYNQRPPEWYLHIKFLRFLASIALNLKIVDGQFLKPKNQNDSEGV